MTVPQQAASDVQAPVAKAATALGSGAGASMLTLSQQAGSFLPTDLGGWLAAGASCIAMLYTLHLMGEWYWKKVLRPCLERRGWVKARPPQVRYVLVDPEQVAAE